MQRYRRQALRLPKALPEPDPGEVLPAGRVQLARAAGAPSPGSSTGGPSQPHKLARPAPRGVTALPHILPSPEGPAQRRGKRGAPVAPPASRGSGRAVGAEPQRHGRPRAGCSPSRAARGEPRPLPGGSGGGSRGGGSRARTGRADRAAEAAGGAGLPLPCAPCPAAAERRSRQRSRLHLPAVPPPPPPPGPAPAPGPRPLRMGAPLPALRRATPASRLPSPENFPGALSGSRQGQPGVTRPSRTVPRPFGVREWQPGSGQLSLGPESSPGPRRARSTHRWEGELPTPRLQGVPGNIQWASDAPGGSLGRKRRSGRRERGHPVPQ